MRYLLCLFSCLVFTLSAYASPLIIFDAGSSGTRMYVYDVENAQVTQLSSVKTKPGLSSLDPNNSQAMDDYFQKLLSAADNVLDAETKSQTPMYLYATAGMRMLPADQQEALFNAARLSLTTQANHFGYPEPAEVRAISGTEEAAFIWMSDNYLNGNLNLDKLTTKNTVVAVEMGGASSEIAYLSPRATQHTVDINNKGKNYQLYSYAYDGLGADKAMAAMVASGTPGFASCFPVGAPYPLETGEYVGTGNLEACVHAIKHEFIDLGAQYTCQQSTPLECSGFGVYQPVEMYANQWLLTSAFYYLFNTLQLADQYVSYANFVEKANAFCKMNWNEVKQINQPANILINYCFNAALTKTLFDSWHVNKKDKLRAVSSINGTTLEWPVGAALTLGQ